MDIETQFNTGDVVYLDLGLTGAGCIKAIVMLVNVEVSALRQYITYTVSYYGGKSITVPESMLSRIAYTVQEKTEEEQGKKKELTADKLRELLSKSKRIYWNEDYYDVFSVKTESFILHDDFEEYIFTYEEFIERLKKSDFDITFYQVVKLEY